MLASWVLLGFLASCVGAYEVRTMMPVVTEPDIDVVLQKWHEMEENMITAVGSALDKIMPELEKYKANLSLSDDCLQGVVRFFHDARELRIWSIKMIDAIGKPAGGNLRSLGIIGSHEECMNISVSASEIDPYDNTSVASPAFKGKYCSIDIRPPLSEQPNVFVSLKNVLPALKDYKPKTEVMEMIVKSVGNAHDMPFRWGICLPSVCQEKDIQMIIDMITKGTVGSASIAVCDVLEDVNLTKSQICIIIILVCFVIIVVIATFLDHRTTDPLEYLAKKKDLDGPILEPPGSNLIRALSLIRNMSAMMSSKPPQDKTLSMFQGIRFFATSWVVLSNVNLVMDPYLIRSIVNFRETHEKVWTQFFVNGLIVVDIFFYMTAVIVGYFVVKKVDDHTFKFNINTMLIKRVWRLMPAAMLMVGFVLLMPHLNTGPSWTEYFDSTTQVCSRNWWHTLTLSDNLYKADEICLPHLWYISADIQMYFLGMIYLILLFKKPIIAYILLFVMLFGSMMSTALVVFLKGYPPIMNGFYVNYKLMLDFFWLLHSLPYNHYGVYAIGLALGTYLARNSKLRVSIVIQVIGWVVSVFLGVASIFVTYFWENGREASAIESVAYHTLYRLAFTTGLSWLVLMCATGNGGLLHKLLSWRGFVVMNKPSYSMYLSHYLVLQYFFRSMQGPTDFEPTFMFFLYFCNLMASYVSGGLVRIFFEAPLENMGKLFLGEGFSKKGLGPDQASTATQEDVSPVGEKGNTVIVMNEVNTNGPEAKGEINGNTKTPTS